ncbi:right-handed parallel beta-helix repeat-containing protein [Candidatus Micrarchaeota archaeon]|nr:right-handed parallel beta-helix repeat-containing protein [Candidatus Micrarchaeota archaeon]
MPVSLPRRAGEPTFGKSHSSAVWAIAGILAVLLLLFIVPKPHYWSATGSVISSPWSATGAAVSSSSCGVLPSAGEAYALSSNVSSEGTCFSIGANGIALDCNGFSINYALSQPGFGIVTNGFNGTVVRNCAVVQSQAGGAQPSSHAAFLNSSCGTVLQSSIFETFSSSSAIQLSSACNTTVSNSVALALGGGYGISLDSSPSNYLLNNSVFSAYGYGISLASSSNNSLRANRVSSYGGSGYSALSIYRNSAGNAMDSNRWQGRNAAVKIGSLEPGATANFDNLFSNDVVYSCVQPCGAYYSDYYLYNAASVNFLNTSINVSTVRWGNGSTATVSVAWPLFVTVDDFYYRPLPNASVSVSSASGLLLSALTGQSGEITGASVPSLTANASSSTSIPNVTILISKDGYMPSNITIVPAGQVRVLARLAAVAQNQSSQANRTNLPAEQWLSVTGPPQMNATQGGKLDFILSISSAVQDEILNVAVQEISVPDWPIIYGRPMAGNASVGYGGQVQFPVSIRIPKDANTTYYDIILNATGVLATGETAGSNPYLLRLGVNPAPAAALSDRVTPASIGDDVEGNLRHASVLLGQLEERRVSTESYRVQMQSALDLKQAGNIEEAYESSNALVATLENELVASTVPELTPWQNLSYFVSNNPLASFAIAAALLLSIVFDAYLAFRLHKVKSLEKSLSTVWGDLVTAQRERSQYLGLLFGACSQLPSPMPPSLSDSMRYFASLSNNAQTAYQHAGAYAYGQQLTLDLARHAIRQGALNISDVRNSLSSLEALDKRIDILSRDYNIGAIAYNASISVFPFNLGIFKGAFELEEVEKFELPSARQQDAPSSAVPVDKPTPTAPPTSVPTGQVSAPVSATPSVPFESVAKQVPTAPSVPSHSESVPVRSSFPTARTQAPPWVSRQSFIEEDKPAVQKTPEQPASVQDGLPPQQSDSVQNERPPTKYPASLSSTSPPSQQSTFAPSRPSIPPQVPSAPRAQFTQPSAPRPLLPSSQTSPGRALEQSAATQSLQHSSQTPQNKGQSADAQPTESEIQPLHERLGSILDEHEAITGDPVAHAGDALWSKIREITEKGKKG